MRKLLNNQKGDTIIEVLIAVAILAVILTGAYVASNHSLTDERVAQEHAEALTIAQTQVEDLASGGTLAPGNDCFTINPSGNGSVQGVSLNCYVPSNNISQGVEASSTCAAAAPYCYKVAVTPSTPINHQVNYNYNGAPGSFSVVWQGYAVNVTWPSLNGGQDSVVLYYRSN